MVITGVERRRRFSAEQKQALLAEAFRPGGSVAEVCRREAICSSLLYRWRRLARSAGGLTGFQPAVVVDAFSVRPEAAAILAELPGGARVSVAADAPASLVAAVLRALR